jgi:tetratricopeptide (TPR) repeat protein
MRQSPKFATVVLAVSGLQGMRFLIALTEEVFHALHETYPVRDAVAHAEHPYSFVVRYGDAAAEFAQRVFHDVAVAGLPDVADAEAARDALAAAVRGRIEDGLERLPIGEIADTLTVAASIFEHDPEATSRLMAARALAQLARLSSAQWDHLTAHAMARRFEAGRADGRWRTEDLDTWSLIFVLDALRVFEAPGGIQDLAYAILQRSRHLADELGTPEVRRDVSLSLDRVGDVARAQGKLGEAETLYREGLKLRRSLADELRTPEARRDVSVSLDRVGDVARAQGKLGEAETLYREGLDVARSLADELGTPEARRDVSVSLDRVGDVARAQGKLGEAETLYREGLESARAYRQQQPCPDADAIVTHFEEKLRSLGGR